MSVASDSAPSSDEGQVPARVFEKQEDGVDSVVWHPDGQRIITGSSVGGLRVWDVETGQQLGETIKGHTAAVYALDVSRDGTMLATGSWDRTLKLWHLDTREAIHAWEDGHQDRIYDVHFSPDAKRLVSGSGDGTLRVWDVESGALAFEPVQCRGYVWAVRYSPNGGRIASGGDGVQIRDVHRDSVQLVRTIEQSVNSLAWTHDSEQLITGALGNVIIWDAPSGEEIRSWEAHRRWIDLSLSPTTTHLATCDGYGHQSSVVVFDIEAQEQVSKYDHGNTVADVAYSPSGNYIATACEDKVYLWAAPSAHSSSPGSSILNVGPHVPQHVSAVQCF
ncbi:WD40-repeat-containing domain protein [Phlebopus sp. FC_14]|nr:WD40-repeat-containing domain protein [Phlebopus sp. FC_14]